MHQLSFGLACMVSATLFIDQDSQVLTTLRLDLLRGLSGAERLSFTQELRRSVFDSKDQVFETVTGCPAQIFLTIGHVLLHGKDFLARRLSVGDFDHILAESENLLSVSDDEQETFPTMNVSWKKLAEAHRHVGFLHILRFPDPFLIPSSDIKIQESASAILNAYAGIPAESPLAKRLLLPLFMAGADSGPPHQRQYLLIRINQIKEQTGFRNPVVTDLLQTLWDAKAQAKQDMTDSQDLPWMEWVTLFF